jgi:hypothetical protein
LKVAGVAHGFGARWTRQMVVDVLVQSRRQHAAKRLLRKPLKRQCRTPWVMITDKLASDGAAKREVMPSVEHRMHKGLNNRADNSHQPTRCRERGMKRFKSAGRVQRFLSADDQINNLFLLRRDHLPQLNVEPPGPKPSRSGPRSPALPLRYSPQRAMASSRLHRHKVTVPARLHGARTLRW